LLLFSLYALFIVETVTFPKMDDALDIIRKRYAVDEDILGYIQMKHKCCGIRNYTDWREIISKQDKLKNGRWNKGEPVRVTPAVVPSCCKLINHCGVRLYRQQPNSMKTSELTSGKPIPYVHNVEDYVHTNGCYSHLRVHADDVYEAMRMYSCATILFVFSIAIVFWYYWWKKTRGSHVPRGWPSPPMDVNSVVYDQQRRIFIAFINPFIHSVIRRSSESEEKASSSKGQKRSSKNRVRTTSRSSSGSRPKPVRFLSVT
jgi:hypothetical protein